MARTKSGQLIRQKQKLSQTGRSLLTSSLIQILVLAGIAIFLILKLRSVLGTREGFEKPALPREEKPRGKDTKLEVIEGGPDRDITDHVDGKSPAADALASMKEADPSFTVTGFLQGARAAYEMIITAFDKGEIDEIRPYLGDDVEKSFADAIQQRSEQGLSVESTFIGIREMTIKDATFDSGNAEITMRFVAEMTSAVKNVSGDVVEGDKRAVRRQRDVWTFGRKMSSDNPNWQLVATGE